MQNSALQLPDGSYEVQLPGRKLSDDLPDNLSYVVIRLKILKTSSKTDTRRGQFTANKCKTSLREVFLAMSVKNSCNKTGKMVIYVFTHF
ncbi:hypothetical protein HOLleu_17896 [Holothuria leucospilota]|uniref:Uncharacterized protein n=1 Tax=Holothuria leucospilota TaxID=206669 RepID=A0A9Q1C2P3_HOLLE|nr:hypothetical protein HOLleu_17896 [Holothuria leucospilota]